MKVTALAGGVGGAKLIVGLQRVLEVDLTAVVNTGDDAVIYDVRVCPDVDTVTYWASGLADTERGWGIRGDSFDLVEGLRGFGHDAWFSLGDRDFATCMYRTQRLGEGATLTQVTDEIRRTLGVTCLVLPMSDDDVATHIIAADGRDLAFQEYFVRERCEPDVAEIRFEGIEHAVATPQVLEALHNSDVVVVCPSNPLVSIGPILALARIRDAVRAHPRVVCVTPLIRGKALKGPADALMRQLGHGASASSVARLYADFCDLFVVDASDPEEAEKVAALGIEVRELDTIMRDHAASERLARELLG